MMERIRIRVEKILEYKSILEDIKGDCEKKILYDPVYRGALLHYLYLLSDSCISLAEVIIRARSFVRMEQVVRVMSCLSLTKDSR
jgi:uncharacterized protein YutE (UPF0331/DUF86 family)